MNGISDTGMQILHNAFTGMTVLALLLCFCNERTFPWIWIDRCLHGVLQKIQKGALPHKCISKPNWQGSLDERVFIMRLAMFGVVCIATFPFADCSTHIAASRQYFLRTIAFEVKPENPFEHWEAAVLIWSVVFFWCVQFKDGLHAAKAVVIDTDKAFRRGMRFLVLATIALFGLYFTIMRGITPIHRVSGEMGLVVLFCFQDLLFMREYSIALKRETNENKQKNLEKDANNYLEFLLLVDIPGICAFGVILGYLVHRHFASAYGFKDWGAPFASGAAALNLLLINVVYSALAIWQRYADAGQTVQSLITE